MQEEIYVHQHIEVKTTAICFVYSVYTPKWWLFDAVQVENEYGSYGNDYKYMQWSKDKILTLGLEDVLYFTSDGPCGYMLQGGTLPDTFKVANFGSGADATKIELEKYQDNAPFMCGEFWNGWFDHWGSPRKGHDRSDEDCVAELDKILALGGSFNLYMFHGGTNFDFMAGANVDQTNTTIGYTPDATSYDYGAPLDECGDITNKYLLMRECIKKYTNVSDAPLPAPSIKKAYDTVRCKGSAELFDVLDVISNKLESPCPYNMEHLDQVYGYILYRTKVSGPIRAFYGNLF